MSRLLINKQEDGTYQFSGIIDESSDFSLIDPTSDPLIIDFENLSRINSYGIRKWIAMLNAHHGKKIIYRNCPVVVVDQLNLIPMLKSGVTIESFYLPFICPNCEDEIEHKLTEKEAKDPQISEKIDSLHECPNCKVNLEFSDELDEYFSMLEDS